MQYKEFISLGWTPATSSVGQPNDWTSIDYDPGIFTGNWNPQEELKFQSIQMKS